MIKKYLILTFITISLINASSTIDKKINNNKKILNEKKSIKTRTKEKIKKLAQKITEQNKDLEKLEKDIKLIDDDIKKHENLLNESQNKLSSLKEKSSYLKKRKTQNEVQIVNTIVEDFTSSIALNLASKQNIKELVDNEIYTILSENSKDEILKLNNSYDLITNDTLKNKQTIKKIADYIQEREKTKETLNKLKQKHSKSLGNLEFRHKIYQKELKKVVQQQESLKNLLSELNILKKKEIEREKERKKRLAKLKKQKEKIKNSKIAKKAKTAEEVNQSYANNLDLDDVRKIGSSTSGVKITRYRGSKTIAPLKSFDVIKKFGTYYDPVYKIKLFNESIVLKTKKPKAKVVTILNGKIVYAKKNAGMLENVVIVQHQNGLHTIYSHLDEIAPTLKVGKWVRKGYVVGRVNDSLMFQATKNSYHINPKDLFKI